jgi:SulP family sulfate permease
VSRRERAPSPFRAAPDAPLSQRVFPLARDLRGYGAQAARRDVVSGLTVAALAIPSGMAYAQLAGLTPVIGLYTLLLPVVAYALLGSSRQVAVGPEGSLAALVAASLVGVAAAGSAEAGEDAAALALMVGACFLLTRVARLEWIADYLSRAVLVGYLHGVSVVLIVGQTRSGSSATSSAGWATRRGRPRWSRCSRWPCSSGRGPSRRASPRRC